MCGLVGAFYTPSNLHHQNFAMLCLSQVALFRLVSLNELQKIVRKGFAAGARSSYPSDLLTRSPYGLPLSWKAGAEAGTLPAIRMRADRLKVLVRQRAVDGPRDHERADERGKFEDRSGS